MARAADIFAACELYDRDLAEARREIERLKARNEELRSLLTDARTLIEKQTEWQKYGENLERDADATMAQELKDQRAKVVALKAEVERLKALVEAEQRGSFSSVVRQVRNELDTAIGERDAIRAENKSMSGGEGAQRG